jgi:hypothetical protein
MGVKLNSSGGKYSSRIRVRGETFWLGSFTTARDAETAYLSARKTFFGEYA